MEPSSNAATTTPVAEPKSFIHRSFILLKAHYFLFFSAFGILYPVLNITLRGRGLSNAELSSVNAIIPFIVFFTNPLFGFAADHSRQYKLIFNLVFALVILIFGTMFMLPTIKTRNIQADMLYDATTNSRVLDFCASQEVATKCASRSECGCSYQANCSFIDHHDYLFFTFTMSSNDINKEIQDASDLTRPTCGIEYRVPIDEAIRQNGNNTHADGFLKNNQTTRFASCDITCSVAHFCHGVRFPHQMFYIIAYSILFILGANFFPNSITLGAALGFASLPKPDIFGQQRLWGTVGFGISAFLASRVYEYFHTEFVYLIMFFITGILCIIVTCFIRIQPNRRRRVSHVPVPTDELNTDDPVKLEKKRQRTGLSALIPSLKKLNAIIFISLTFIWGTSYGVLDPYLFLFIDEIAPCQSRSIVGWMALVSATSELIALFLAGRILKFLGIDFCSVLILLAFAIRFAGYYFILQPYYLIVVETMHFFCFGILYVLIAQEADAIAPRGLSGTLQGVAYGTCFGLGRGIGLLISWYIYNLVDQRSLFLVFSIINLVAAVGYGTYFLIKKKRSPEKPKEVTDSPLNATATIQPNPQPSGQPLLTSET